MAINTTPITSNTTPPARIPVEVLCCKAPELPSTQDGDIVTVLVLVIISVTISVVVVSCITA